MVTGGAGYIGSHICVELMRAGNSVVIFDNFCNSHREVVNRIKAITGISPAVICGDVRDRGLLTNTLATHRCDAVIHLAGLKSIAESISDPVRYYDDNVIGALGLVQAMRDTGVDKLVFSSSATVYGEPVCLPLREDHPLSPNNPYGRTKLIVEHMLGDVAISHGSLRIAILRYFNPAGAHESGSMGEDPLGMPNNLMPFLAQVAVGRRPHLTIFGGDYDTPDGTGVRDYVHVMDLAAGHLRALEALELQNQFTINLGTGRGTSVLDLVHAFSTACGKHIPIVVAPRREGDVPSCYACPDLAQRILGWRATRDINEMCRDAWKWQSNNPEGYGNHRSSN